MKRFWVILMGVFVWGFLMIPGIYFAHTHTLHTGVHAESPFDAPKGKKSLHCELLRHQNSALPFCPHTRHVRSMEAQFKADCGDHPFGTQVQTSWSKTFLFLKPVVKVSPDNRNIVFASVQFLLTSLIPDSLDKPPQ